MLKWIPMNLQKFAEDGSGAGSATPPAAPSIPQGPATPEIDYDKLSQILQGKQAVTEDSVLKGYFKQQGLSGDEMAQAIAAFKQQKAAQQPDVGALQQQAQQAQALAQQATIEKEATLAALGLGLDAKTIPYVLKLANLGQVMGQDGKINEEALKNALNKVLEDVPALKPAPEQTGGFRQIGASGGSQPQQTTEDALKSAFGLK